MAVLGFQELRNEPGPLHLAIGIFDGVHLGHRAILKQASEAAARDSGEVVVLTFWPHPSHVIRPEDSVPMLVGRELRTRLLLEAGADTVVFLEFTAEFAKMEAEAFPTFLKESVPALKTVSVGEGFRFGRARVGDAALFCREGAKVSLDVRPVARVDLDGVPLSSTLIREKVAAGKIAVANRLLGYPYLAEGRIIAGEALGRKIGFPTLNLGWLPDAQPRLGVYAVRVAFPELSSHSFAGVANYGCRPTVSDADAEPMLEVHLLEKLPQEPCGRMEVAFHDFIRAEERFDSVEALAKRIEKDVVMARNLLADS